EAAAMAAPALLEPMMDVEVVVPEDFLGAVLGEINSRRGMVQGLEERHGAKVVRAHVPLAELFGFTGALRGVSQGRASNSMHLDSYVVVPQALEAQVLSFA
ncbi:MAG: elongation factor G, partial [Myxococcota bacterium]